MKRFKTVWILMALALVLAESNSVAFNGVDTAPEHKIWDELLKKYVNEEGFIDYKGIISEKDKFEKYLDLLSNNAPSNNWNENEKLAYWINAYNAFTVKLIVDNYPLESIKDLNPILNIPTVYTVWTKKWFKIGDEDFSLDKIEHDILRKEFKEPRIHFVINCASFSCPVLRPEAFKAEKIETQLVEQTKAFINDPDRNRTTKDKLELSKIFSWFDGDFKEGQTLIQFLNKYSKVKISKSADIDFMDYEWSLNDASKK